MPRLASFLLYLALLSQTACAPVNPAPASVSRGSAQVATSSVRALPTTYLADRFALAPVTIAGDTLILYTDTGGGANMLFAEAVTRLALHDSAIMLGADTVRLVALPDFRPSASIPSPQPEPPFGAKLILTQADAGDRLARAGFLGRTWFAGRVWRLDYPRHTLSQLSAPRVSGDQPEHRVPIGFQTDSAGHRTTNFPRIRVEIDGDSLDLLFDTGATVTLTDSALAQLADGGPRVRGTSFIAKNIFDRWTSRHPNWRVIPRAEHLPRGDQREMPMIEVPSISVGGYVAGPVWFTMRPDPNFHDFMSKWMDKRIEGALGGSALRYFRIDLDYPNAAAWFEKP